MNRLVLLLIAAVVFAGACTDVAGPPVAVNKAVKGAPPALDPHGHDEDTAPRISLADAKKDFDDGTAVFIDTHSPDQYASRHITGSINVPANQLDGYFDKIPKGKKIIAYCS